MDHENPLGPELDSDGHQKTNIRESKKKDKQHIKAKQHVTKKPIKITPLKIQMLIPSHVIPSHPSLQRH